MKNVTEEQAKADQSDSELELKAEDGKECGFRVRAKTDDEAIEHARMHQKMAHGVRDISPDLEKKIKAQVKVVPIKIEDSRIAKKKSLLDTCL
jgi:predicted small metal-binding protein